MTDFVEWYGHLANEVGHPTLWVASICIGVIVGALWGWTRG